MRVKMMMAAVAAATMLAGAAQAQTPEGEYRAALERMITSTAAGACPEDVMAGQLLATCTEQLPQMGPQVAGLGAIETVTFLRAEGEGAEHTEFYSVKFAAGVTLTWGIGGEADGKFERAFAFAG